MKKNFFFLIVFTSITALFAIVEPAKATSFPVPDTGQTVCYDKDGNLLDPCPAEGEPFYGQDAQYTINPPSYTKLDENGQPLSDDATEWAMVRDNRTRLIWEVKTDDGGIHDKDNLYTWYDSNPETNGGCEGTPGDGTDTEDFINTLNEQQFGGYSDWRLPTIMELVTIVDYGRVNPAFDPDYFPNSMPDMANIYYWSSTSYAFNPEEAWGVSPEDGYEKQIAKNSPAYAVRAVRGEQIPGPSFVDNGDGTVSDTTTGLMWAKNIADIDEDNNVDEDPDDRVTWEQALAWCENLSLAGYDDWRLPTIKELRSILDFGRALPAIDTDYFPDASITAALWSSTSHANNTDTAWFVDPDDGKIVYLYKGFSYNVRAVRGGQHTNIPPTADAGVDRYVKENSSAVLDGSASLDPDDGIKSYHWVQTEGPAVTLSDASAVQPTFTVPSGIIGQTLTFELTVTDYQDASDTDSVTLTVVGEACAAIPDKPVLISPADGAVDVDLSPVLKSSEYNEGEGCSTHFKTRWQISDQADFSGLTYNANTFDGQLTSHQVTKMVLKPNTTYYWRVKYWGDHGLQSPWSDVSTFTTVSDDRDADSNGVPDDQETHGGTDINENGIDDSQETDLRTLLTADGDSIIGIECDKNILSIAVETMSEDEFDDMPPGMLFPYGMIGFRVNAASLGATVHFTVYLDGRAPINARWYKVDNATGWYDFTSHVSFSANRKAVSFTLTDGGTGDADGAVNGVIVDPAGLSQTIPVSSDSGSSCFISTLLGL